MFLILIFVSVVFFRLQLLAFYDTVLVLIFALYVDVYISCPSLSSQSCRNLTPLPSLSLQALYHSNLSLSSDIYRITSRSSTLR